MTTAPRSFQEIILRLQTYWASQGCAILQPYDMEVGAGTFHPATTLRALGSRPWAAAMSSPRAAPPMAATAKTPTASSTTTSIRSSSNPRPLTCKRCISAPSTPSASTPASTTSALSRMTGKAPPSAHGVWDGRSGATAWKCRSSPISSRSAAMTAAPFRANSPTASNGSPCMSSAWATSWRCPSTTRKPRSR